MIRLRPRSLIPLIPPVLLLLAMSDGDCNGDRPPPREVKLLHLANTAPFDPLQVLPEVPPDLASEEAHGYWVLQFREVLEEADRESLESIGVSFHGYVPEDAYIVHLGEATREAVGELDSVRALVPFQPAYRVAPALLDEEWTPPTGHFDVHLFGSPEAVRRRIEPILDELGGELSLGDHPGKLQVALLEETWREAVRRLALVPEVRWIESTPLPGTLTDRAAKILAAPQVWSSHGLTGRGQIIGIADSGLDAGQPLTPIHPDFTGRVVDITSWETQPGGRVLNPGVDDGAADEQPMATPPRAGHGTHVAGCALGDGTESGGVSPRIRGLAYEASLFFQAVEQWTKLKPDWLTKILFPKKTFVWEYALSGIPQDLSRLFREAHGMGARIHSNSWADRASFAGYTDQSRQVDAYTWSHPELLIVYGAGNEGRDTSPADGVVDAGSILAPSTAKNCLGVGATENERGASFGIAPRTTYGASYPFRFATLPIRDDYLADDPGELFATSGRGPTPDRRVKPDVVAPGTYILSTRSSGMKPSETLWGKPSSASYASTLDSHYVFAGGTSMATPLAAGSAALIRQYLTTEETPNPSAALVKAVLVNGAVDLGTGAFPGNGQGWGRIDLEASLSPAPRYSDVKTGLFDGMADDFRVAAEASGQPLRVTLVWSDYPATLNAAASKALVNDLDLEVTSPNGEVYRGNHLKSGWSPPATSATKPDSRNNVENVYLQKPAGGVYTVRVRGSKVPYGPQPYALVVRGAGVELTPPDPYFTVRLSKNRVILPREAGERFQVRVYSHFGFDADVDLHTMTHPPEPSIDVKLGRTRVTPPTRPPYFDQGRMTVRTSAGTPSETFRIEVGGSGGSLFRQAELEVVVRAVDAIAVWQHQVVFDPATGKLDWDIWYSMWDNALGVWWTPIGAKAAGVYPALSVANWNKPQCDPVPEDDFDPAIAFDHQGGAQVVWARHGACSPTGWDIWTARWVGRGLRWGWKPPEVLSKLAADETDPAIAIDDDGAGIALWVHHDTGGKGEVAHSSFKASASTAWGPAKPLPTWAAWMRPGEASLPEIAFTSKPAAPGGATPGPRSSHQAVAIWTDVIYRGLGKQIHYLIWNGSDWVNGLGSSDARPIPGQAVDAYSSSGTTMPRSKHRNGISADGKDHAWAVWSSEDSQTYTNTVDRVHYARWDGAKWDPATKTSPKNHGHHPAAAYHRSGTAITVYANTPPPKPREAFYFYDEGDPIKGATCSGVVTRPAAAALSDDNVLAVWWCDGGSSSEIWSARSSAPEQAWQTGRKLTALPRGDRNPAIASPTGSPTRPPRVFP